MPQPATDPVANHRAANRARHDEAGAGRLLICSRRLGDICDVGKHQVNDQ
jgi:hypothetical protein